MQVPVNGHPFPLLPALNCGHVAIEVGGDFLPRIQPVFGRSQGWWRAGGRFSHHPLLNDSAVGAWPGHRLYRPHRPRQSTVFDGKVPKSQQFLTSLFDGAQ
jgi:hypothetical protein